MIGIYRIYFPFKGISYVGSSVDVYSRINAHYSSLIKGNHHNSNMQKDFNEFGINLFTSEVLCLCSEAELIEKEQIYIDNFELTYNKRSSEIGSKSRCQVKRELIKVELSQVLINKIEVEAKKQNRTPSNYVETVIKNRFKNLKDL